MIVTGFVYIWYDKKRKLYCVGSHMGTLDDGYTSSTGTFPKAYKKRPEDFKRKILYLHEGDERSLREKEQYFLNFIKPEELFSNENLEKGSARYYNQKPCASGLSGEYASKLRLQFLETEQGKIWLENLSKRMIGNEYGKGKEAWNKGKECPSISEGIKSSEKQKNKWTQERLEKRAEKTKLMWESGVFDNRPKQTKETIEKRIKALYKIYEIAYENGKVDIVENGIKNYSKETGIPYPALISCIRRKGSSFKYKIKYAKLLE